MGCSSSRGTSVDARYKSGSDVNYEITTGRLKASKNSNRLETKESVCTILTENDSTQSSNDVGNYHDQPITCSSPRSEVSKRFNLTLNVSDDDVEHQAVCSENSFESPRSVQSPMNQSFTMSPFGAININGFHQEICRHGIGSETPLRLPMKERLVILGRLGAGASSVVYKALDISEMRLVAVKMIPISDRSKRRQMVRELGALYELLRHKKEDITLPPKHVSFRFDFNSRRQQSVMLNDNNDNGRTVECEEDSDEESVTEYREDDDELKPHHIYTQNYIVDFYDAFSNVEDGGVALMMEHMDGGSLQSMVDSVGCTDEGLLASIAAQTLAGLSFLHQCSQIHRDVKPANLLINSKGEVKISDLGIMVQNDQDTGSDDRSQSCAGTAAYMAPERLDGAEYSYPSDIWSLGMTLLTIALGRKPVEVTGGFWNILQNLKNLPPPSLPSSGPWSSEFRDFLSRCLQQDPALRDSAADLLNHPFIDRMRIQESSNLLKCGKNELEAIIVALCGHVERVRSDPVRPGHSCYKRWTTEAMVNWLLLGDGLRSPTTTRDVISIDELGENIGGASRTSNGSAYGSDFGSSHRLQLLATQLHLPLSTAIKTAVEYLARSTISK